MCQGETKGFVEMKQCLEKVKVLGLVRKAKRNRMTSKALCHEALQVFDAENGVTDSKKHRTPCKP